MKKIIKDKRVIVIALVVIFVLMLMDFNQRMVLMSRLRRQEKGLIQVYADLKSTHDALKSEITYANSDEAVEEWAREEAGMIQEGDIPIVLLPQSAPFAKITNQPEVIVDEVEKWEIWQELFFGD